MCALAVRAELGLGPYDVLDPRLLAAEYGIPILTVGELTTCPPETRAYVMEAASGVFSALVPVGTGLFILENDAHAEPRRRASLGHEMAHVLWEHRFTEVLVNADGCRAADPDMEEEAERLGHELLLTTDAAFASARRGLTDEDVAVLYGVSVQYARMRMNRTGARKVAHRAATRRAAG